jgi:hypothetical protein
MEAGHSAVKVAWLVLVTVSILVKGEVRQVVVQANNNQRFYIEESCRDAEEAGDWQAEGCHQCTDTGGKRRATSTGRV